MGIKALRETGFIVPKTKEFEVTDDAGVVHKFIARELSYTESQMNVLNAAVGKDHFTLLVASANTDEDGEKLTYEEVLKLPPLFAATFLLKAIDANKPEKSDVPLAEGQAKN